jgi:hypothetical protein
LRVLQNVHDEKPAHVAVLFISAKNMPWTKAYERFGTKGLCMPLSHENPLSPRPNCGEGSALPEEMTDF